MRFQPIIIKAIVVFFLSQPFYVLAGSHKEIVIGPVYEIKEVSLLDLIMNRLHDMQNSGELQSMQDEWKRKSINAIKNPVGVNLPNAKEFVTHYYDPSIVVQQDIHLPDGSLLHKAGTEVNPLSIKSLSKRYIFINGTDSTQLAFAKRLFEDSGWRDKVVLVKGSYADVIKEWGKSVYFDQRGFGPGGVGKRETLVQRFQISALPSVLYQENKLLRIDAIPESQYQSFLNNHAGD